VSLPVLSALVAGPAFWQTTEIEVAAELIEATPRLLVERVAS